MWDEIIHPSPNFNGATVEVWEWMSNFIPHFTWHVVTYITYMLGLEPLMTRNWITTYPNFHGIRIVKEQSSVKMVSRMVLLFMFLLWIHYFDISTWVVLIMSIDKSNSKCLFTMTTRCNSWASESIPVVPHKAHLRVAFKLLTLERK